jgi:farnesyl-diphosphate farnesyltransferase
MTSIWNPDGLSQEELMIKDECIVVNNDDQITGHASKKDAHIYSKDTPRGKLHRAFSVFLFNEEGKLLLQQRAAEKITFPNVWTNTCCSHPLYGCTPNEVDEENAVLEGKVDGIKSAAIRKLKHELGIDSALITKDKFKYLTRLHYWAADVVTYGANSPWGEHEIDYILFVKANVPLNLNPEEVQDTKYVTLNELKKMMKIASGLIWSPWFRIIVEKFLVHWWADLDKTLNTDSFIDYKTIYRFDPTSEHMGGGGNAREWLGNASSPFDNKVKRIGELALKQGAYGKVKIHKHSLFSQLIRPSEIMAGLYISLVDYMPSKVDRSSESLRLCDYMLGKVSRSFAAVIRQLPKKLCTDIVLFYLALRALDTIEDDMESFSGREQIKIKYLQDFYKTGLVTDGWKLEGVGEGDEKVLLESYFHCVNAFKTLSPASQEIISDISKRMGAGMASFVEKDLGQGTVTIKDYNLYCHYVAGLVGEGLSRLFTCSGYESEEVAGVATTLANTMGLFLQKTNIIRDYLEDYIDGRAWWPQEIWKLYAKTNDLGEFAKPENKAAALACLNHLVTDALECVPECLEYMTKLRTEEVFRFCAIPQVMAIATLAEVYNNYNVFTGVVKIRKGLAACMILDTDCTEGLHKWFHKMATTIQSRIPKTDPNAEKTKEICNKIISLTRSKAESAMILSYASIVMYLAPIGISYGLSIFITAFMEQGNFNSFNLENETQSKGAQAIVLSTFALIASVLFVVTQYKLPKADKVLMKIQLTK